MRHPSNPRFCCWSKLAKFDQHFISKFKKMSTKNIFFLSFNVKEHCDTLLMGILILMVKKMFKIKSKKILFRLFWDFDDSKFSYWIEIYSWNQNHRRNSFMLLMKSWEETLIFLDPYEHQLPTVDSRLCGIMNEVRQER